MPPAPQTGGQSDNSTGILWGVAALFVAIGMIWFFFRTYIISFYLVIKLYEVNFLAYVTENPYFDQLSGIIHAALANPSVVAFNDLLLIGSAVGGWLRIPAAVIFIVLAVAVYFGNAAHVFKRKYKMQELAKLEKGSWPYITPVVGQDLLTQDINKGPWAMAMTPMQFCKRYRLIAEVKSKPKEGVPRQERNRTEVVLIRGQANKLFSLQLGPSWQGAGKLPIHRRALFAVFAARINADSKAAEALLHQMAASSTGKMDFSGVNALLKKHENTKLVKKITESHAYVFTAMASMLEAAREDGVIASAEFIWLKPKDRKLWYILNTVGRQTPFVEVAGIFAHWLAEKEAERKLIVPVVEEATKALEIALQEIIYKRDEDT